MKKNSRKFNGMDPMVYQTSEKWLCPNSWVSTSKAGVHQYKVHGPITHSPYSSPKISKVRQSKFKVGDFVLCLRKKHKPQVMFAKIVRIPLDENGYRWVVQCENRQIQYRIDTEEMTALIEGKDYWRG